MGQGVEISNLSTESAPLPAPLAGVLAPGQRTIVNSTVAILTGFGIAPSGSSTLQLRDLGASYTGPYVAANQGSLNADGSVTGGSTLPDMADGSDGNVVFDGTSTVLGLAPSSMVYTLTRHIYPNNMTVNAGVTIKRGRFGVFAKETYTNNGTDIDDGNAAVTTTAGAALAAAVFGASFAGGAGHAAGAGSNGTAATTSGGGAGGNGGAGTGGSGAGTGGGTTAPTAANGGIPRSPAQLAAGVTIGGAVLTQVKGGAGGGGGGDDGTGAGGGGGGGGGIHITFANKIINNGRMGARGGAGAAGGATNCGGGGGGGGGFVGYCTRSYSGTGAIDAAGGAGGAGTGTGAAGSAGAAGTVVAIVA
jgi:hypothetical protein